MRLRALAVATATGLVVAMAPTTAFAAKPAYKVSISISTKSPDTGQTITVSGKVAGPKSAKKKLIVQRKYGNGSWKPVKFIRTTKKSRYSTRIKVSVIGDQSVRVVAPKSSKRARGTSKVRTFTAWRWLDLTTQESRPLGDVATGPVTIAGKTYPKALTFGSAGAYFNAGGQCSTLRVSLGTPDGEVSGGFRLLRSVTADATPQTTQVAVATETAPRVVTFPLTGIATFAFGTDEAGYVSAVNPQARCTTDKLASPPTAVN